MDNSVLPWVRVLFWILNKKDMLDLYKRSLRKIQCYKSDINSVSDNDTQLYISATLNPRVLKPKGTLMGLPVRKGKP